MRRPEKIAIIGLGLEGRAVFNYLKKKKKDAEITFLDLNAKAIAPKGEKAILGRNYLKHLKDYDVIYRSPGVPYNLPEIRAEKHKISSLIKLFFDEHQGQIIGVTGSAGKTTTANMVYAFLKSGGKDAYLAGNIGQDPLIFLNKLSKKSLTVLELSSFQLQDLTASPNVAVILDIYEEHLDKHRTFKEYLKSKANIGRFQSRSDYMVYNFDNKYSRALARRSQAKKISFSLKNKSANIYVKGNYLWHKTMGKIISLKKNRLQGDHNRKNIMAALAVALVFKIPLKSIQKTIDGFEGTPHRIEFVRKLRGVGFYNDSKATNVGSAVAGIDSFSEQKIVLSGGHNKNLNLKPLAMRLSQNDVKHSIFFGEARGDLAVLLKRLGKNNFSVKKTLNGALREAFRKAIPGEVVLLEPGTSSFDEFKNYSERGDTFKKIVRSLK